MANLIPPSAKKRILYEYWMRVVTVWFLLIGLAAVALAVLHVPVYILIENQLMALEGVYTQANEQNTSFEQVRAQIVDANDAAMLLASEQNIVMLGPYITKVDQAAFERVTISQYAMKRDGNAVASINLSGVAATRASLVAFSEALEAMPEFERAEIPLSNLAKDTEIPFNIIVELSTPLKP